VKISTCKQTRADALSSVPSMVSDLVLSSAAGQPLDTLLFGGASPPDWLARDTQKAFPTAMMYPCLLCSPCTGLTIVRSQGYGLTETNSIAVAVAGEDYAFRSTCAYVHLHNFVVALKRPSR
jgi:acyl-CoA synthetase (AMP-forming)/AMP-acid ligase II